jgi:hypothetical protein
MGGQQEAGIAAAVPGLQGRAEADEAFDQADSTVKRCWISWQTRDWPP